jgi:ATP-binding cassette subfamily B protein
MVIRLYLAKTGARFPEGKTAHLHRPALLKNAPIILLDEATASLDPENEVLIQRAISKLIEGKTVVVVAHRLRTGAGADKIVVLDGGSAVEEGTHEELIAKKGLYERLYSIQRESLGWSV